MAKTFSFEEAQAPVAQKPKTFSFEEAFAKPQAAEEAAPKVFSFEEAQAPAKPAEPVAAKPAPTTAKAPSDTNIFGERNVEGIMGVPSVKGPLPPITSEDAFSGSFGRSIYNLGADATLLGGKISGDTEAAQKRAEELRAAGEGTYTPTDKSFTEAPLENFAELLGGSLPYMAAPAAAAMAAPMLGPAAITAPLVGGATSALQFTGSNLARQMENNKKLEDTNLLTAGLTAIPQAALDIYGFRLIPGIRTIFGKAGMDISEATAAELAKKSLLSKAGEYALGTGKIMGLEGATETGQQLLERLQAGLSITDEEARKEYFDSFVGGAVLGGALAIPGSAVEYAANKFGNTEERAAEEAKQSALEAWKTKGLTANLPKRETYDDLVTKYTSLGQTKENAVRLANQDIADQQEAENARRIDSGVARDSAQISGEPGTEPPAEGTEQSVGPTVDGVGVAARPIEEGTVQQPAALEPTALIQTMQESGRTFKTPAQVKNFLLEATPEVAQLAAQTPTLYKDLLTQFKAAPIEAVQAPEVLPVPEEVVSEIPEAAPEEPLPDHITEGKHLAAKLRSIDPDHPKIPVLLDDFTVTPEDVEEARLELATLRNEPAFAVAPPPSFASPDEQVKDAFGKLNYVFDPSAFEDIGTLKQQHQEHKDTRIQALAGLQDLVNDPQYADTYVASAAQELLSHPSVKKEEVEAASKLQYPARQSQQEAIVKQAIARDDLQAEEAYMSAQSVEPNQIIRAEPSANIGRMADIFGQQLYGDLTNMADISIKELFQNSFDALKDLIELEGKLDGRIDITTNSSDRTVTISDNGNGMTPDIIQKAFLTLAGTHKVSGRSSGGFGIAKMQFLFGNKRLQLSTVHNGVKSVLDTTGKQLKASFDNPELAPNIYTEATDEPNGTTITITIPETFLHASTGEEKDISFAPSYAPDSLTESPLFEPIAVTYNGNPVEIGNSFPYNDYVPFANVNFAWGNARIVVSKQEFTSRWADNVTILSNGLLQFGLKLKKNPLDYGSANIPRRFFVNVEPKVKPEEPGYPFELSRQGFSKSVKEDFEKIFKYLTVLYRGNEAATVSQGFGDIEYIYNNGGSSGAKKLSPSISNAAESLMLINEGDDIAVVEGKLIVNGRQIPELTADTLEKTRVDISKFKIDQGDIDPNSPMLHTNLGVQQPNELERLQSERSDVDNRIYEIREDSAMGRPVDDAEYSALESKKWQIQDKIDALINSSENIPDGPVTPVTDLARAKFGNRFNTFVNTLGNIFIGVRNEIVNSNPTKYDTLGGLGIGVSFDYEYHGVHVRVPFQAMFVNPAALKYDDVQRQADSLYYTMVHEAAHYKRGGHDADFWAEDNELAIELRAAGVETVSAHKLRVLLTKDKDIVDFLRNTFHDPKAKNIGVQLEDAKQSTDVGLGGIADDNFKDEAKIRGGAKNQAGASAAGRAAGNSQPNQQGAGAAGQNANNTGVPKGAKAGKSVKVDNILLKIRRSESPEEMGGLLGQLMEADSWADKKRVLNTIWNTLDSKSIATLLPALTTSQITDWVSDKIPHLDQVNRLVERMAVTRSKMLAAIDDTVKPWADFAKAHTAGGKLLSRLMHYSTLAEVDPSLHANAAIAIAKDSQLAELRRLMDAASNPRTKAAYKGQITSRTNRITTAYKLWNEAGRVGKGEAHGIFTKVRDHYKATFSLHRAILDERIAKSNAPGDINDASTPKGRLMAAIRKTYEDAKQIGVYFPLMRYGNYWMSLGKGPNKEFYMFESELQRNMFLDKRVAQLQKAGDTRTYDEIMESGEFDAGNDLTKLRNLTTESSEMLQGIFKIIDTQNVTDKEALKDAVYQMYLLTMPEQSFRKQFIHRKGTTGFSGDSLRNFVRSGYASANQLTRLQFGPDITTEMDSAHASLEGMPPKDKIKLSQFLNEVGTRVGEELAPSNEDEFWTKFANGVNQAAFFWRLTSIKSAVANMTALPIFGYPVLASKYGEVKAAAALAKYTNVFNHTSFVKPDGKYTPLSIGFSKHVQANPILAAAFEEAAERGITEITRTYDLIAMARTPSATHQGAISRGTRAFVNFTGLLFHHSERLNREIMFMTSFELAYKKGLSEGLSSGRNGEAFTRAIDEAVKNTYDSMFNYTKYNRPRIMRSPAARIVFQFKLFPQQVTAYLLRNFLTMIKGSDLNPRARREATTQLVGTLMMTGMFAGVVGMPLYSMVVAVIQGIRNALRDDDDPIPIEERDLDLWFRNVWLPEHFGEAASFFEKGPISTITNADIASSTSLNNLWFRDTKYDHSVANQFSDFILGMAGPGASLVTDGFKAYDDFKSGHFNQGVEKLLPAFAKGSFTQWAWGKEGIKVKGSQAEIFSKEEVTNMMRLWKAFGFNPTELARIQETNYPAMELVQRAKDERGSIMNRLDLELVQGDDKAFEEALIRASRFTDANPEMAIMPDTIIDSAFKRAKLRAMADRGLIVPPKLMPRMYEFIHASRPKSDKAIDQERFEALVRAAESPTAEEE